MVVFAYVGTGGVATAEKTNTPRRAGARVTGRGMKAEYHLRMKAVAKLADPGY